MITKFKLFEKSSLTPLGVPEEVMKEIQINFEIDSNARWAKMKLKKDVLYELKKDERQFFVQLEKKGNIFIFINDHQNYSKQYFKLETDGWGSFRIDDREAITYNQLRYSVNINDDIYMLQSSDFKTKPKKERRLKAQTEELEKTTSEFKIYIMDNFNKIIRSMYGAKYKKVMNKIAENLSKISGNSTPDDILRFIENNKKLAQKAKEYENAKEEKDLKRIKELETQYNSLTIFDEKLLEFEDHYSNEFSYYVNIENLINDFGRMYIETAFMYYLYTNRFRELQIRESLGINSDENLICYHAQKGYISMIKKLLEKGVDVNSINSVELTPLLMACREDQYETVEFLIKNGADVNYQSAISKTTALMISAINNTEEDDIEYLILLSDNGADWNRINMDGRSFLEILQKKQADYLYNKIIELYPDKYKNYMIYKKSTDFNL